MSNMKAIEIIFENLDWVRIPTEFFREFSTQDIEREEFTEKNRYRAGRVAFVISPWAKNAFKSFQGDWLHEPVTDDYLWKRLKSRDITSIRLIDKDNSVYDYLVDWEDEPVNQYKNQFQRVEEDDEGGLCVTICNQINYVNETTFVFRRGDIAVIKSSQKDKFPNYSFNQPILFLNDLIGSSDDLNCLMFGMSGGLIKYGPNPEFLVPIGMETDRLEGLSENAFNHLHYILLKHISDFITGKTDEKEMKDAIYDTIDSQIINKVITFK